MRRLLSGLIILIVVVMVAACGSTTTTAIPTSNPDAAIPQPTGSPNSVGVAEGTAESTAEVTREGAVEATAESTAEGTAAVLNTAFTIQITGGDTNQNVSLSSDNGSTVSNDVAGVSGGEEGLAAGNTGTDAQASSSGQQVLNTPVSTLRTLTFSNADQSYVFDLIFSDDLPAGQYQIGIDNVQSTIGNNINEDSGGQADTGTSSGNSSEATVEAGGSSSRGATANSTAQAGSGTNGGNATGGTSGGNATGGNTTGSTTNGTTTQGTVGPSNAVNGQGVQAQNGATQNDNAPANSPQQGIVERDENFAPTIAARLESTDANLAGYNLVQGGTLTLDSINQSTATGSFKFTMSPADDPTKTITVSGTFTDVPLSQTQQSTAATSP
jgi:hypothetical protein